MEGERGLSDFGLERETYCCDDFDHQNDRFMCFFILKVPEQYIWVQKDFLFQVDFGS